MRNFIWMLAVVAVSSCAPSGPAPGLGSASGSLGITSDDSTLLVAEPDLDELVVLDATSLSVLRRVKVGDTPEKVLVAPDDTTFVTNRFSRSVSIVPPGATAEAGRLAVGVEPVTLALLGSTLFVVNSARLNDPEVGSVMAFDVGTRELLWETPVGNEPRAAVLLDEGRLLVSHYKTGRAVVLATDTGAPLSVASLADALNERVPAGQALGLQPRGLEAMLNANGRVLASGLLATERLLVTKGSRIGGDSGGSGSGYGGGGSGRSPHHREPEGCGGPGISQPALFAFTLDGRPDVDDVHGCTTLSNTRPATRMADDVSSRRSREQLPGGLAPPAVQGPGALAVDPRGDYLYVANRESNNLAIIPLGRRDQATLVLQTGAGPTGVVVNHAGQRAYVHNGLDHTISVLSSQAGQAVRVSPPQVVATDVLSPQLVLGRKVFFNARDERFNNVATTNLACATCHLEGRDDGHVWNTSEGPRQTPHLAGKMMSSTAPFHWNADFPTFDNFMVHTVRDRMGGTGAAAAEQAALLRFLDSLPLPDRGVPADAQAVARGQLAYEKAECNGCHVGVALTNNKNALDVGTYVRSGPVRDDPQFHPVGLNTPSLLGISRSAPYLHAGQAPTLRERIARDRAQGRDLHGKTSRLSDGEVDDLVAYLKTL